MQVTDRSRPDAPSLTQTIIVQMVYYVTSISADNTGALAFFLKAFLTTFRRRIFLKPMGIHLLGAQRAHFL